jgi:predicted lipoprotein
MSQHLESPATSFVKRPPVLWGLLVVGAVAALVIAGYAAGVRVATIQDINKINEEKKALEFDPIKYVDSVWESQVIPTILEKATDFSTLAAAIQADPKAAEQKYGHSETGAYNFMAKGRGKVIAFDASTSSRTLDIDVEPYDGQKDLSIQIGPVIKGFSLRDGPGVISFNSVGNQIEYGKVNRELNSRVAALYADLDPATLQDQVVEFYGTFTLDDARNILLTPVKLDVVEGS